MFRFKFAIIILALTLGLALTGCGGGGGGPRVIRIEIKTIETNDNISASSPIFAKNNTVAITVELVYADLTRVQNPAGAVVTITAGLGSIVGNQLTTSNVGSNSAGKLTAVWGGLTGELPIIVTANASPTVRVQSITINPAGPVNIKAGQTQAFTANATLTDASTVNGITPTWTTTGGVGTVSTAGVLTAATNLGGAQTVNGTVRADFSTSNASASIVVSPGNMTSGRISAPTGVDVNNIPACSLTPITFTGEGLDSYSNPITLDQSRITWQTTGGVGTIANSGSGGLFTPISAGNGQITAVYQPLSGSNIALTALPIKVVSNVVLTGTVTDSNGNNLSGVVFVFVNENGNQISTATSQSNGQFSATVTCAVKYLYVQTVPSSVYGIFYYDRDGSSHDNKYYQATSGCMMEIDPQPSSGGNIGSFRFWRRDNSSPPPIPSGCDFIP